MQSLAGKCRYLLRRLAQSPMFAIVAIMTLAVGIGANTAIFSVVNGVLLKPLPFDDPERLVGLWHTAPGLGFDEVNQSPALHFTYLEEGRVFEEIGMWDDASVAVTGLAEPEQVRALLVTYQILPMLGVRPRLGRTFSAEDDSPGKPLTALLSYAYWQRRFGGDPGVIGRKINIDGRPCDILGVTPQNFHFLRSDPAVLLPFQFDRGRLYVGNFSYQAIARLKPGVTIEQANADVVRMIPLAVEKFSNSRNGLSLKMLQQARFGSNIRPLKQDAVGDVGKVLLVLMGTVGIILLIACANVANLFLVRSEGRQQELAIRAALGARWGRIARELLSESMTLSVVGGVFGTLLAYSGIRFLVALRPDSLPRLEEIAIDPRVLLFTLGVSLLAGLVFGLIPVFKYARPRLASALKEGGRSSSDGRERHRARAGLVVSQIALALVLLISSGLMMRTFQALRNVNPGFARPDEVLTVRISIPAAEMPDQDQTARTHEQILRRIEQIPGVVSAGLSSSVTMDGHDSRDPIFSEDFPVPEGQLPAVRSFKWISPNYFHTMGNPVLAGRDFTWADLSEKKPVVIITENLARDYWPDPSAAVGRRIRQDPGSPWREIVGVVGNVHDEGVNRKATAIAYWPMLMKDFRGPVYVQRTLSYAIRSPRVGNPGFLKEIQQAVWSVNRGLPLAEVRTVAEIHRESMAQTSFTLIMLGIAAGVALLLGLVGIYGVISYTVSQRTREIGIRMALGAQQKDVSGLFVRQGLLFICVGVALGLAAAVGMTRLMSALLFGVSPMDPMTYAAVSLGLAAVALLASYIPARRATAVDPVEALRWE